MGLVNDMLQRVAQSIVDPVETIPVSRWATRWAWILAGADGITVVWMLSAGSWLDRHHTLLSMASWGGHHDLVAALAAAAFVTLAVMAPLTRGFSQGSNQQTAVVAVACFVSLAAVCGVLALALLLGFVILGIGVVGTLLA
jgi:hypothetical protein